MPNGGGGGLFDNAWINMIYCMIFSCVIAFMTRRSIAAAIYLSQ